MNNVTYWFLNIYINTCFTMHKARHFSVCFSTQGYIICCCCRAYVVIAYNLYVPFAVVL